MSGGLKVGVLGGGQLGRMLALAGAPLGASVRCYDEAADACAGPVAGLEVGAWTDAARLESFARGVDVVTYEFENVPVESVRVVARHAPVWPPIEALRIGQDRLEEKTLFGRLGIGVPTFAAVSSRGELDDGLRRTGLPAVLKTRRGGYDGKGQAVIRGAADVDGAWAAVGAGRVPLIVEAMVPFERELSVVAARGRDGAVACYPLTQNEHRGGILRQSVAPAAGLTPALQEAGESIARRIMGELGYVGVLAVELFEVGGVLLANEIAPRVHNSGHWTMDAGCVSQFEQHLRAVAGLGLGETRPRGVAGMVNLIGAAPALAELTAWPWARVHLYGKPARAGRKLGHVNVLAGDEAELAERIRPIRAAADAAAR